PAGGHWPLAAWNAARFALALGQVAIAPGPSDPALVADSVLLFGPETAICFPIGLALGRRGRASEPLAAGFAGIAPGCLAATDSAPAALHSALVALIGRRGGRFAAPA